MDIAQDFAVKPLFDEIPKVKWVTLEEPVRYMQIVGEFLIYD